MSKRNRRKDILVEEDNHIDGALAPHKGVDFMALVKFKDGHPVAGALNGIEVVEIPKGVEKIAESAFEGQMKIREIIIPDSVQKIGNYAFRYCNALEKLHIPDSIINHGVIHLGQEVFTYCKNLKELRLPHLSRLKRDMFLECGSLEKVDLSAGVDEIDENTFSNCKKLKEVDFGETPKIYKIAENAFKGCSEDLKIKYSGILIPYKYLTFVRNLSDGLYLDREFAVLQKERDILRDDTFSPILISNLCASEHDGRLDIAAEQYKQQFQTIGFYDISDDVDVKAKEKLTELFKTNTASRGVVPRIIDALTIVSTALHIPPEQIVKSFEDKKFRDAIIAMRSCHEGNHFFDCEATLFAMNFDVNTIKQTILRNPYKDFASVLLCKFYLDGNKNFLNVAKWVVQHPEIGFNDIMELFRHARFLNNITPNMTLGQINSKRSLERAQMDIEEIEMYYDVQFSDCVCNLPKTEVELGRYKAYIMDGQDLRQVTIGYDTYCCQHFDGAGESAMMYGLVNPDAGFWVIEDKLSEKIMAQAETWKLDDNSLVFDNIEFADDRQISQFAPIIAKWCEAAPFNTVLMGDGYNELQSDNIRHVSGIEPPITEELLNVIDTPYTDARESCSVLKSEGIVEPYFKESLETYYEQHPEEKKIKIEKEPVQNHDEKNQVKKKKSWGRGR